MPVEDEFDRAEFFDENDFAVEAEWRLADGSAMTKPSVQVFAPSDDIGLGAPDMVDDMTRFHAQVSELPDGYGKNDLVTVDGITWRVAEKPKLDETATIAVAKMAAT